jgi:hypothetical protein
MSDTIDHFGGEGHDINLAQEAMRRKRQDRENTESPEMKNKPQKEYREEMKKASQDLRFKQNCKDVIEHFSQADEEVFAPNANVAQTPIKAGQYIAIKL